MALGLENTLNGLDPNTLAQALEEELMRGLAQRTTQATQAAQQAGQQYQQAAGAPPPQLAPEDIFLPTLLGNIASVIGQNPDLREKAQERIGEKHSDMLKARADNLMALRDIYGQKAEAASKLGNTEAEEKARISRDKMSRALDQLEEQRKQANAIELENMRHQHDLARDKAKPAGGSGVYGQVLSESDPQAIAESIIRGESHPDPSKLGRVVGPIVSSILAKRGFNQQRALQSYNATARHFATLNGRLQLQIRQSANTVLEGLNEVERLADELYKVSPSTRMTPLNKVIVKGSREWGLLSPEAQDLATQLNGQVSTLIPELSNIYSAGGVPTDRAMKLAEQVLNPNWPPNRIKSGINRERANINFRINAINETQAVTPESVEAGGFSPATQAGAAQASGQVLVKAPNGKTYAFDSAEKADAFKKRAGIK